MADGDAVYVEPAPAASLRERGEGSSTQLETSLRLWKDSGIKKTSPTGASPPPFRYHLILAAVYFLMFTPLALIFKLIGRDALQRRLDPRSNTYWQIRATRTDPAAYYRQF